MRSFHLYLFLQEETVALQVIGQEENSGNWGNHTCRDEDLFAVCFILVKVKELSRITRA